VLFIGEVLVVKGEHGVLVHAGVNRCHFIRCERLT
jgi:hypothetical protein